MKFAYYAVFVVLGVSSITTVCGCSSNDRRWVYLEAIVEGEESGCGFLVPLKQNTVDAEHVYSKGFYITGGHKTCDRLGFIPETNQRNKYLIDQSLMTMFSVSYYRNPAQNNEIRDASIGRNRILSGKGWVLWKMSGQHNGTAGLAIPIRNEQYSEIDLIRMGIFFRSWDDVRMTFLADPPNTIVIARPSSGGSTATGNLLTFFNDSDIPSDLQDFSP